MSVPRRRWAAALTAMSALGVIAACADDIRPTDPITGPRFELVQEPAGFVTLCKVANQAGTFHFDVANFMHGTLLNAITEASGMQRASYDIAAGECLKIWQSNSSSEPSSTMQIVEVIPEGWTLEKIVVEMGKPQFDGSFVVESVTEYTGTDQVFMEPLHGRGRRVTFHNKKPDIPPPPPPGNDGCTPGFWKAPQHHQYWQGFSPTQTIYSIWDNANQYGVDGKRMGKYTLDEGLSFQGGSDLSGAAEILMRAAIAALLNSAHDEVDYALSTADVIAQVRAALDSRDRNTMLELAMRLDTFNNKGCTVDTSP